MHWYGVETATLDRPIYIHIRNDATHALRWRRTSRMSVRKPHPCVPLRATEKHVSGVAALFSFFWGEGFHLLRKGLVLTVLTHVQVPSGRIVTSKAAGAFRRDPRNLQIHVKCLFVLIMAALIADLSPR